LEDESEIGAVQGKILRLKDKEKIDCFGHMLLKSGRIFLRGNGEIDHGQYNQKCEILSGQGSCLMVRRSILYELGGFDEDYFIYSEDVDLCWRIWLRGHRVLYVPTSIVYHMGEGTMRRKRKVFRESLFMRNYMITLIKNLESFNLLKFMILFHLTNLAGALFETKNPNIILVTIIAASQVLLKMRSIWQKRKRIQILRKISDCEFLPRILVPVLFWKQLANMRMKI
jgi:GT2 family glycosyltransferase